HARQLHAAACQARDTACRGRSLRGLAACAARASPGRPHHRPTARSTRCDLTRRFGAPSSLAPALRGPRPAAEQHRIRFSSAGERSHMIHRPASRPARVACRLAAHLIPTTVMLALPVDVARAQQATPAPSAAGRVEGQAKDALDRPLAGVALRLETPDGRVAGRATSDAGGRFAFTGLAPGLYSLVGEHAGFQTGTALVSVPAGQGAHADL